MDVAVDWDVSLSLALPLVEDMPPFPLRFKFKFKLRGDVFSSTGSIYDSILVIDDGFSEPKLQFTYLRHTASI